MKTYKMKTYKMKTYKMKAYINNIQWVTDESDVSLPDPNKIIQLTENRKGGIVSDKFIVTDRQLQEIEKVQYKGGFKRFDIDIFDEVADPMIMDDLRKYNDFTNKIDL